jgi:hypothetical protein
MSALNARRQRARETFDTMLHDTASDDGPVFELSDCVTGAINDATRVRITPEIIEAAILAVQHVPVLDRPQQAIIAAFRAAGFEVVS